MPNQAPETPATHEELIAGLDRIGDGVDALKRENAELRAALREAREWIVGEGSIVPARLVGRMDAALAKAGAR